MSKTPLDRALDLLVYAPLGVVFTARDALPDLIDKGRGRLTDQVNTARVMGQLAVSQGQKEAEKAVSEATRRLAGLGLVPEPRRASPSTEAEGPSGVAGEGAGPVATASSDGADAPGSADGPGQGDLSPAEPAVSEDDLAIPGYASLSAPQVVQRLAGLSMEELEAVRSYEAATRHRKTILTRISQLQSPQS